MPGGVEYPFFHCLDIGQVRHPLIASAGEKMRWAEVHLEALQRNTWDYFKTPANRPALSADRDEQSGYHVYRISSMPDYSQFAIDVALRIGDVISNVRASLDHAIWGIVADRSSGTPADPRGAAFPIAEDEPTLNISRAGKAIKPHLTTDEWDIVRLALLDQPYPGAEGVFVRARWGRWNAGHDHPLRILQTLSNDDKHRLLPTVLLLPNAMTFPTLARIATRQERIGTGKGALLAVSGPQSGAAVGELVEIPDTRSATPGTAVALDTEVYSARYADYVEPHIDNAGEITPFVAFNDMTGVVHTLDRVACFVKFLLSEFERVLPPKT